MTDLLGGGETRVYFLPEVRDPGAPTVEELEAGTELTDVTMFDPELGSTEDVAVPVRRMTAEARTITLTFKVDASQFIRNLRRLGYNVRRLERALRRGDPKVAAMHADYARRRKARHRRR